MEGFFASGVQVYRISMVESHEQVCYYLAHLTCQKMRKQPKETLLEQERYELKQKSGGGVLRYEVWGYVENGKTIVTRYNMAYINHAVCSKDNGRVLGYDNAHGYHHRHYMGSVEACDCVSHEDTVKRFQAEWVEIVGRLKGKSS